MNIDTVTIWYGRVFSADSLEFRFDADGSLKGVLITRRSGTIYLPAHCIKKIGTKKVGA